jgi:hypothetical protein
MYFDKCTIVIVSSHDACSSCYHSMIHVLNVIGLCIKQQCDIVLYGDHPGDHRYVIHLDGFKLLVAGQRCHNVDSFIRDTASHSNHWVVRSATVTLNDPTTTGWYIGGQRSVIIWGPLIWGPSIWGPSIYVDITITIFDIRRYQYNDIRRYI